MNSDFINHMQMRGRIKLLQNKINIIYSQIKEIYFILREPNLRDTMIYLGKGKKIGKFEDIVRCLMYNNANHLFIEKCIQFIVSYKKLQRLINKIKS